MNEKTYFRFVDKLREFETDKLNQGEICGYDQLFEYANNIKRYFGDYTDEEIKQAIELAIYY